MQRLFTILFVFTFLSSPFTLQSHAATLQLPKTGQTTSFATGDDGDLEVGVAWPTPRFTDNSNGTITDNLTGLIWLQDANCFDYNKWVVSLNNAYNLSSGNCGLTDGSTAGQWRLPNIVELESLIIGTGQGSNSWLNSQNFLRVQDNYWTSTDASTYSANVGHTTYKYQIYLSNGSVSIMRESSSYSGKSGYGWAVRDGVPGTIQLSATGDTDPIANNADGGLKKGGVWPNPRFIANDDNQTVTDALTGLIWMKDGFSSPGPTACGIRTSMTIDAALAYVECLTRNSHLGKTDWRLPNRKEMMSIVNWGQQEPGTWLNSQGFTRVQGNTYWTNSMSSPSNITVVDMRPVNDAVFVSSTGSVAMYFLPVSGGTLSVADTVAPVISNFTIPSISNGLTISITTLASTDNTGVTGYCVKETAGSTNCTWSSTVPNNYTFSSVGNRTLYAYTKDAAGNVSNVSSATVTVTVTVPSEGVSIKLPQTGQTTCWNETGTSIACPGTGQDGDTLTGLAWPDPRFTANSDQTVTDNLTGLIWSKDANPAAGRKTWQLALDYIKTLNSSKYLGYSDWRLPNINELKSLVNQGQSSPATWLNSQGFSNVQSDYAYWSSTTHAYYTYDIWVVVMDNGNPWYNGKTSSYNVWPVRGGQLGTVTLFKTGQTTCYDTSGSIISCSGTGQDGELQIGANELSPRFTVTTSQTVIDNLSGLIWAKDGLHASGTKTWQGALDYIKTINSSKYLGYGDWRLPNLNELESLVNWGQSSPATWLNGQGFANVQSAAYWSSTAFSGNGSYAWFAVYMNYGFVSYDSKTNSRYVWPVRGGQSGLFDNLSLSVTKSGTGSGTVTSSNGGISCGSTCSATITTGTSLTLIATPDSGSTFTGWTGACSGTGACTVSMDAAKSVTATFAVVPNIQTWTINSGNSANGTVNCTSPVNNAAISTCTVTPASGYQLSTFTDNSVDMKSSVVSGSYSIANVTADHTIAAIFTLSTSTSNTTSKAKVFLGVGDDIVTVSNSGMTVYGNTGIDTVTIADGVVGVTLDQSVERINLPSVANSYAFKQTGNKINVYDAAGVTLLVTVPVQGDSDGTLLLFSNGTTSALLSGGLMTLGGVTVSSTAAGVIVPTLTSAP